MAAYLHLDYNLMRDPKSDPTSEAAPEFLSHGNHKIIKNKQTKKCLLCV